MRLSSLFALLFLFAGAFVVTSPAFGENPGVAVEVPIAPLSAPPEAFPDLNYDLFGRLPLMDRGRVKPLHTFAKHYLRTFAGFSYSRKVDARAWLAELLFNPNVSYQRPLFPVDQGTANALNLPDNASRRYSFYTLWGAFRAYETSLILPLYDKPLETLEAPQKNMLALYIKLLRYFEISRSFSFLLPDFLIHSPRLAEALNVPVSKPFAYLDILQKLPMVTAMLEPIAAEKASQALEEEEEELVRLASDLRYVIADRQSSPVLRIIPQQWDRANPLWLAPWQVVEQGEGSPKTAIYLQNWKKLAAFYRKGKAHLWKKEAHLAASLARGLLTRGKEASPLSLFIEDQYVRFSPFNKALAFMIVAFVITTLGLAANSRRAIQVGTVLLGAGVLLTAVGLGARILIMGRAPVATLYESILFVALVGTALALFLGRRWKHGHAPLVGSLFGTLLLLLSLSYEGTGDTFALLSAVLNTNFWLATHVLTITAGYAFAFIAGGAAHIYLWQFLRAGTVIKGHTAFLASLLNLARSALLLTTAGTVLGAVWADQSWGRFWGWDPKENGALLIIMWLLWLIHAYRTRFIPPLWFAAGLALTTVFVAFAWFGVNMLGAGLHAYGFEQGRLLVLITFTLFELAFVSLVLLLSRGKEEKRPA
jgi:ABC-type transport system involved in cytochrome c biogenesis permease subunit